MIDENTLPAATLTTTQRLTNRLRSERIPAALLHGFIDTMQFFDSDHVSDLMNRYPNKNPIPCAMWSTACCIAKTFAQSDRSEADAQTAFEAILDSVDAYHEHADRFVMIEAVAPVAAGSDAAIVTRGNVTRLERIRRG